MVNFSIRFFITIFLITTASLSYTQNQKTAANRFTYPAKILKDFAYLGTPEELARLMIFKTGYVIGDIGGEDGKYSCILSLMFDSLYFYVEDIDPKKFNKKTLNKNASYYSKIRKAPQTSKFNLVIGTTRSTNLPDTAFNALLLKSSLHEFGFAEEMIEDLDKKLKPGGEIIVIDAFSPKDQSVYCNEGHRYYTIAEASLLMEHHGYFLTAMRGPSGSVPNYSNVLIFEKDKEKSKKFLRGIYGTMLIEKTMQHIALPVVANDSLRIKEICDSVKMQFTALKANYSCLESWLTGFGIVYYESKNYVASQNVFAIVKNLFPESYQAYYWLGETFFVQNDFKKAFGYYIKSVELNKDNFEAEKRLVECRKKLGIPPPPASPRK